MLICTRNSDSLSTGWFYNEEYQRYFPDEDALEHYAEYMKRAEEQKNKPYELEPLPDTRPDISDEQIRLWAQKYNTRYMTQKDYQAFIDDLISAGVLETRDRSYVRYDSDIVVLGSARDAGQKGYSAMQPLAEWNRNGHYYSLTQAGGNVKKWAEGWKAAYGDPDNYTANFERRQLALFDEISWILGRMEDAGSGTGTGVNIGALEGSTYHPLSGTRVTSLDDLRWLATEEAWDAAGSDVEENGGDTSAVWSRIFNQMKTNSLDNLLNAVDRQRTINRAKAIAEQIREAPSSVRLEVQG